MYPIDFTFTMCTVLVNIIVRTIFTACTEKESDKNQYYVYVPNVNTAKRYLFLRWHFISPTKYASNVFHNNPLYVSSKWITVSMYVFLYNVNEH